MSTPPVYDMTPVKAPRTAGFTLRLATFLVENRVTGPLLTSSLFKTAGITALREAPSDDGVYYEHPGHGGPDLPAPAPAPAAPAPLGGLADTRGPGFRFTSAADLTDAYRRGETTPAAVLEAVLAAVDASNALPGTPLRALIAVDRDDAVAQAREATRRWQAGTPLGPLDGVPISVKDELDVRGYRTTVGTRFLGKTPAARDAAVVARLRAAGAVLFGKCNMHEIGIGVSGINPHHGTARNPYDPGHVTGGSSSGSASAVAAGLGPISVGADGGGSVRIPAGLCGVVGLKPTFGRLSELGAAPLCWTVAHIGPLAATVRDAALAYAVMAGADADDPASRHQPSPYLLPLDRDDLRGLRIGIQPAWLEDADPPVVAAVKRAVAALVARGAEVVEVSIPELGLARAVQLVTIVGEMASAHAALYKGHRKDYGLDTRLNLALARRLKATDYIHAQRVRRRIGRHFLAALAGCDLIVTPTTAGTAKALGKDALARGESDLVNVERMMRFVLHGNITGLPALTVPVGVDPAGLPIGLQLIGRPWDEARLLQVGAIVERASERARPKVHYPVLG